MQHLPADDLFNPTEEHRMLRQMVAEFARREVEPQAAEFDHKGALNVPLFRRLGELGLLGITVPDADGGAGMDTTAAVLVHHELAKYDPGFTLAYLAHSMLFVNNFYHCSNAEQRAKYLAKSLSGEWIGAMGMTEPGYGTDVLGMTTTAVRDGDEYVVNGEKIFITSGMRADWITVAVRTGEGKGAKDISLLLMPGDSAGLSRSRLDKMGWQCSDTAHLRFDGVRVPARYLLGEEGAGFKAIMGNFNAERFGIAAAALGFAQACYDEALAWAQQRKTFGSPLVGHQVMRHKLIDMQQRIRSTSAWLEQVAARADAGDTGADWVGEVCVLKNHATQTMQFCADAGVQILGGMGYMRGTVCERIYREVKVLTIGGGTEEIMKDLAARQWGVV